jgi:hypothetical protein
MTVSYTIDQISPATVGEDKIGLKLAAQNQTPLTWQPFQVDVDYSATAPEGIVLPMELVLQGPDPQDHKRRVFTRSAPESFVLVPEVKGPHFILFRELGHNRWQGRLLIEVDGEDLDTGSERT